MPPILLATVLTLFYAFMWRVFLRERRRGVIPTRMGDVVKRKSPRHYAALDWFNLVMFPVGGLVLVVLWIGAISRTFS